MAGGLRGARARPGRRGGLPAAQLGRRGHHLLRLQHARRDAGADRALLRSQGAGLHPPPERRPGAGDRVEDRPARLPGRPGHGARRAGEPRARRGGGRHRRRRVRIRPLRRPAPGGADRRPGARRPRRRGGHRLHLGHDGRPQGGRAHAPHPGLRGAPALRSPGHARSAEPGRCSGGPCHRHARWSALPALQRATHLHDRRLGPAHRPRRHGRGAHRRRERVHVFLHEPPRQPRLRPRARGAHAVRRARRLAHPQRGGGAGGRARDFAGALLRVHRAPIDHGFPARRPQGQAHPHRRPADGVGRDPHRRRGRPRRRGGRARRDPEPGTGPLCRLHGPRARRRRRSTPKAGSAPATSA